MKVRCDRVYALFLKTRYEGKMIIVWENGLMTVTRISQTVDLAALCAE